MPKVPDNILPMAPRQPIVKISETDLMMAAAMMHSEGRLFEPPEVQQVANKGPQGDVYPIQIENLLLGHAQGKLSPAAVHKGMPAGWSANLRRGRYDYEVTGPDGRVHYVQP